MSGWFKRLQSFTEMVVERCSPSKQSRSSSSSTEDKNNDMASDAIQQSSALAPDLVLPPGSAEPEQLEFHDSSDDEANDGEENQEQTDAGVYKSAMALQGFLEFKCPNTCTYGKSCFQKVTLHDVGELRKEFWGVNVLSRKKKKGTGYRSFKESASSRNSNV